MRATAPSAARRSAAGKPRIGAVRCLRVCGCCRAGASSKPLANPWCCHFASGQWARSRSVASLISVSQWWISSTARAAVSLAIKKPVVRCIACCGDLGGRCGLRAMAIRTPSIRGGLDGGGRPRATGKAPAHRRCTGVRGGHAGSRAKLAPRRSSRLSGQVVRSHRDDTGGGAESDRMEARARRVGPSARLPAPRGKGRMPAQRLRIFIMAFSILKWFGLPRPVAASQPLVALKPVVQSQLDSVQKLLPSVTSLKAELSAS